MPLTVLVNMKSRGIQNSIAILAIPIFPFLLVPPAAVLNKHGRDHHSTQNQDGRHRDQIDLFFLHSRYFHVNFHITVRLVFYWLAVEKVRITVRVQP